ncbi:endonuclease/exonuclease/phosphatase, partial [Escherichia coli]|nr:endonuclease/exonuclease/phosphatase [Escherichia coli]
MAQQFTPAEWQQINAHLDADPAAYGFPARRAGSVVIASWNIRKFGALADQDGPKKSAGAFAMIERFCAACDLVAI